MLPLYKLKQLPRDQRLRKLAKFFEAEDLALAKGTVSRSDTQRAYIHDLVSLLAEDTEFPEAVQVEIRAIDAQFRLEARKRAVSANIENNDSLYPGRREINTIRHILAVLIGKQTADWDLVDGDGGLAADGRRILRGVSIFLEDIRSPYNIGSIFRTAESFGVEKIWLSPLCASPDHKRAARTAMGCIPLIPWERCRLEELDGPFFALETGGRLIDSFEFPEKAVLVVGSEELGVSPAALALADSSMGRLSIRTSGVKGSLNVSVAFGIAMHGWHRALWR